MTSGRLLVGAAKADITADYGTQISHLRRILREYVNYYHRDRPHYSLEKDMPFHHPVNPRPSATAQLVALPRLGGLHHRYQWREAA
jgi:hypothetical protein